MDMKTNKKGTKASPTKSKTKSSHAHIEDSSSVEANYERRSENSESEMAHTLGHNPDTHIDSSANPYKEELERMAQTESSEQEEIKVKKNFLQYFKKHKKNLHFVKELEYLYDLFTQGKITGKDKAVLIAALVYFINPFDLIIDITPLLGFTDDFGIIYLAYRYLSNRAIEEHSESDRVKK